MSLGAQRPSSAVSFQISQLPDGHTLLRITVPRPAAQSGGTASSGILGQIPLGQMAMFKSMLVGARLSIAVEPAGQLVRTSSPYVDGSRVTLMDVDLDQLLKGDTLSRLQAAPTPEDARAILDNTPGVKVNLDPEITIEFVAAK
jgi:hypothetical protein